MKLTKFLSIFAIFVTISLNAQNTPAKQSIDSGTIENQFDYLINKSNRYQEYKVVKRTWLDRLKNAVDDSLIVLKDDLVVTKKLISNKDAEIESLTNTLENRNTSISQLNKEKDGIKLLGFIISKPLYSTILWSIIASLFALLLIYMLRFNRSNIITKETQGKYDELEKEYEGHRTRSLEREQQIRRKLQDELNKHKKEK